MLIKLFLLAIIVIAMYMTRRRSKQGAISRIEAYAWMIVWLAAAGVIVRPDLSTRVAEWLGVGRGADVVVYTAIMVLLILVFRLHVAHEELERKVTEFVQKEALKEAGIVEEERAA
ncbi:MAG: DUF2304 domain-containing protein [bacterium]|nr:DUF2304 domain-containing protein [bacterium]